MRDLPPCPIMHETDFPTGWELVDVWFEETICVKHLVPCNDLRQHQLDPSCWCGPTEDDECPDFHIHNSADGREAYEEGRGTS